MNHLTGRSAADASDLKQTKGLRFLNDQGELVNTQRRSRIDDPDTFPFPSRDLIDMQAYKRHWIAAHGYWSLSVINIRGCPYACTWCQKRIFGRSYRSRSAANAAEEMRLIKEQYAPD